MKRLILLILAGLLAGCSSDKAASVLEVLRVGVSPEVQPVIFKQGGLISGMEASFAKELGKELNRRVVFVEVPFDKQIEALEENKTDIIMSGLTVTDSRRLQINFSTPYLMSGQTALFSRTKYNPAGLMASVVGSQNGRIGCVKDAPAEQFVRNRLPLASVKSYSSVKKAVEALKRGKINMFIHDAPILWWTVALNKEELIGFPDRLSNEPLAWGLRKNDLDLLDQVNTALKKWEQDGTRLQIIQNWIPVTDW